MITLHKIEPPQKKKLSEPFVFALTLDNKKLLEDDLEFSIVYTGSPDTYKYDQIICTEYVGPVPAGRVAFNLESNCVDICKTPKRYLFGVTSVVIIGKYKEQEFLRIGYFVRITYPNIDLQELVYDDGDVIEGEETSVDEEEEVDDDYEDDEVDFKNSEGESDEDCGEEVDGDEEDEEDEVECCEEEGGEAKNDELNDKDDEENVRQNVKNSMDNVNNTKNSEQKENSNNNAEEVLNQEILKNIEETNKMDIETVEKEDINEINELIIKDKLNYINIKNHKLEYDNIHIEFCEPPLITTFNIKWSDDDKSEVIEENIDEEINQESEENVNTNCNKPVNDIDEKDDEQVKKAKIN